MLRRTIYFEGEYEPYVWLADIFTKSKFDTRDLVPAD